METPSKAPAPFRYEALAEHIVQLISSGALPPGARAPSVRAISRSREVSVSTVLQAYRLLESRGVLEPRPQSGFYVKGAGKLGLDTPRVSRPSKRPARVAFDDREVKVTEAGLDPRYAPLGCAIPSGRLLGAEQLDRLMARIARQRGTELNAYTLARGDLSLRQAIAQRAANVGQVLDPEEIIITNGCTEALHASLRCLTKPGDVVAIESPTYFGVLRVLAGLDLKALELPTDADTGIDLDALEAAAKRQRIAACLFSSAFSNPLGSTSSTEHKVALLALLRRYDVPLVEDDVYSDIHFGEQRPAPYQALPGGEQVIGCSSFSKTLAPGYRIGWVAPGAAAEAVLKAKMTTSLGSAAIPQAAVAEYLASGGFDRHLRRLRRSLRANVERTRLSVANAFPKGCRVSQPAGGFVLWVELPAGFDSEALLDAALAKGISFIPGNHFSTGTHFRHCLRLSCGHPFDDRLDDAVRTLGTLAKQQLAR